MRQSNNQSNLILNPRTGEMEFYTHPQRLATPNEGVMIYVVSDETIMEGDYIAYPTLKNWVPVQYLGGDLTGNERKIIVTNDNSLEIVRYEFDDEPSVYGLPRPTLLFLQYFQTEYNKGNIIEDVLVEFEVDEINEMSSGNTPSDTWVKVDPTSGTAYISIKKDVWNREEIIEDIERAMIEGLSIGEYRDKWIL